jgi:hypothetical protein
MKRLLNLLFRILLFTKANSSGVNFYNIHTGDSIDIKKWSRDDFIKNFGDSNDSAYALINLFFTKNKRGKTQTILGSAFLIGGITAMAIPGEPGDDQKGFGDLVEPVAGSDATTLGSFSLLRELSSWENIQSKSYLVFYPIIRMEPRSQKNTRKSQSKNIFIVDKQLLSGFNFHKQSLQRLIYFHSIFIK